MNKSVQKQLSPVKCFYISVLSTLILTIVACILFTDFEFGQVIDVFFWVGALTMIIGLMSGGFLIPTSNKYQGQTVAIWTTLQHFVPKDVKSTKLKRSKKIQKMILGLSIAAPGMLLMLVSFFFYTNA